MPTLLQSLQNYDLGQLHITAELWGIQLQAPDVRQGRKNLGLALLDPALTTEIIESLPEQSRQALAELSQQEGSLPWHLFSKKYGLIREMGASRRDREHPERSPISTSERLWYRGLIHRAFLEAGHGPQEYAYIPEDLLTILPDLSASIEGPMLSRPATPKERAYLHPASDQILDHAATLLTARRMQLNAEDLANTVNQWPIPAETLASLLTTAGLLDEDQNLITEPARAFLEAPRGAALSQLASAWLNSTTHDDLRLIPQLTAEGGWLNNPLHARNAALALIGQLGANTWWSISAFTSAVKGYQPDFLRPGGDYNTWYLKDNTSEEYLRGFEFWDQVEGAFLRYLITGPLHWLGILDLAAPEEHAAPNAFKLSSWASALLNGEIASIPAAETPPPSLDSQGQILVHRLASLALRYQIARFCDWLPNKRENYAYRISPGSLTRAKEQGLQAKQLIKLLERHTTSPIPPNILQALERWHQHSTQINFKQVTILQVNHPKVLETLQKSSAGRFLGTQLGPTTVTIKANALERVTAALMQLGYLSEVEIFNAKHEL
ncbi:MAG: helicase-associated domain-containing protein [Chloroflexota bacterium]